MKSRFFFIIFILTNLLFVIFQIDKQSRLVKLTYKKQQLEQEKQNLINKKQAMTNEFHQIKNLKIIKQYAIDQAGMQPISLNKIKRIAA
jgi:cell division protein FtsL